jgi:hypothetical protein
MILLLVADTARPRHLMFFNGFSRLLLYFVVAFEDFPVSVPQATFEGVQVLTRLLPGITVAALSSALLKIVQD